MSSLARASHLTDVASLRSFHELDITMIPILQMGSWCSEKLSKKERDREWGEGGERERKRDKLGNSVQKPLLSKRQSWDRKLVCCQQVRGVSPSVMLSEPVNGRSAAGTHVASRPHCPDPHQHIDQMLRCWWGGYLLHMLWSISNLILLHLTQHSSNIRIFDP